LLLSALIVAADELKLELEGGRRREDKV
jgi:hypothetical protein